METSIKADITRLNLEYLRLVREVAARDTLQASAIFGICQETASVLSQADIGALERIAACGLPMFCFEPSTPEVWRLFLNGRARVETIPCFWNER